MRHGEVHGLATGGGRRRLAALLLAVSGSVAASARETPATTRISNVATVRFSGEDGTRDARSNRADLVVAERLDVTLVGGTARGDGVIATATLANAGNGQEAFDLSAIDADGATVPLAIDLDRDNRFDPARDRRLDGATPALASGELLHLLLLAGRGTIVLEARARTGSGTPGLDFPGAGDNGVDAVVGPTGAHARILLPTGAAAPATLTKTQAVEGGEARAAAGARVTYTLEARFAAAVSAARIEDPVPAGTRLVANSLSLDGAPLSDAADSDPGTVEAGLVSVALGDVAAGSVRVVQFTVTFQ